MLSTLSHLSSAAKLAVVEVLFRHPEPIHLRGIADLSGKRLYSVQLALRQLEKKALVTRKPRGNRVYFLLRRDHPDVASLSTLFSEAEKSELRKRADQLHVRAQSALAFADEMVEMLRRAKQDATRRPV